MRQPRHDEEGTLSVLSTKLPAKRVAEAAAPSPAARSHTPNLSAEAQPRKPDAERTRQDILAVARQEFAEHGLSGARVDAIAARMSTTKRMIYYYFGSKQGLYLAVLEQAYGGIREAEQTLELDRLSPPDAIRAICDFTFDYHDAHPDFVRLVCIENIHHGRNLAQSEALRNLNSTIIASLDAVLSRGREAGLFRPDISAVELHMMMSAPCFYRVSNRHTFGTLFRQDFDTAETRMHHKRLITDAILGLLTSTLPSTGSAAASAPRRARRR
jgi:AcrR family transcriptional regulator